MSVVEDATAATFTGTWTAAVSDGTPVTQVLRWDRAPNDDDDGGLMRVVSAAPDGNPGTGSSRSPSMDATGEVVVYSSSATDLLAPDDDGTAVTLPAGVEQVYRTSIGSEPGTTLVSSSLGDRR